ncbi:LacI family DNA-binding transcriptional regulator [Pararhizobium mangrovi]|uniref:LacI family transcriptional regulator n=1 Tax=Pararhizobium mangrovi TaxID=2590452 RepID=A0A506TYH6_9HYPH|nr:LacI family DNA-binding transcriptional regulator [Pararhizobium mangrovi]TPW27143.1 LacI family transcriptional regulator [Pararhizobium mangrovi]
MSEPTNEGKPPTIAEVAARAGVSRAIASRALSAAPRPVSAEKRARVLKAADELNYHPNPLARSLTTKRLDLVAVVVNHIHDLSDLDIFDLLIEAIQRHGKQVILVRVGSVTGVADLLREGVSYHVDAALVFSDFADAATVRRMFRSDLVVMLNGLHDAKSPAVLGGDEGIAEAVSHAAENGVKTAALVTGRPSSLVERVRAEAYRAAFAETGIALVKLVQGDYSYESGYLAAGEIAEAGLPDAIFCTSDAMAMGVLDARRADFPQNRPTRFRLFGFDNLSMTNFDAYPISSIGYDKADYVAQMLRFLETPTRFEPSGGPVVLPTRFFPRLTG